MNISTKRQYYARYIVVCSCELVKITPFTQEKFPHIRLQNSLISEIQDEKGIASPSIIISRERRSGQESTITKKRNDGGYPTREPSMLGIWDLSVALSR